MSGNMNQSLEARNDADVSTPGQQYPHPDLNQSPEACNDADDSTPDQQCPHPEVEWIRTTPQQAARLSHRAVVGGHEGNGSPLWVIRARYQGDMVPGKLGLQDQVAYVPWGDREHEVHDIEVCCTRRHQIWWQESRDGHIPRNAVVASHTCSGERLYVGRAQEQGTLTPGKIQPSEHGLYISFNGRVIKHRCYETMCYNNYNDMVKDVQSTPSS